MFEEGIEAFFIDFGDDAVYTSGSTTIKMRAIITHNAERNPNDFLSGTAERITTIEFDARVINRPKINAVITMSNGDAYEIDEILQNDRSVALVSVK